MSVDGVAKLLESLAHLISAFIWPVGIVVALVLFAEPIREFFSSLTEFSFKGAGFEASAKRKTEAAAALGAAIATQPDQPPETIAQQARMVSDIVESVSQRSVREARKTTVLWVDDHPMNNLNERRALEALGITIVLSTSTGDALDQVQKQVFQLIISDLGRPPDSNAGLTLLDKLRAIGNKTPYIIYAGARGLTTIDEAKQKGAFGVTNRPDDLFKMVVSVIGKQ